MPLLVQDQPLTETISYADEFYKRFPNVNAATAARFGLFKDRGYELDPEVNPMLVVLQAEYAIISPAKEEHLRYLATDDMTTCVAVFLRHSQTGVTYLCHYDRMLLHPSSNRVSFEHLYYVVDRMHRLALQVDSKATKEFDLHMVGGFGHQQGHNLTGHIIEMFRMFPPTDVTFNLQVFWSGRTLNTCYRRFDQASFKFSEHIDPNTSDDDDFENFDASYTSPTMTTIVDTPIIYGVAINIATGELLNCRIKRTMFGPMTPMFELRRMYINHTLPVARGTSTRVQDNRFWSFKTPEERAANGYREVDYLEIYDPDKSALVVPKLAVNLLGDMAYYQRICEQSDKTILQHFSTSPEVEPEYFVEDFRQAIRTLIRVLENGGQLTSDFFPSADQPFQKRSFRLSRQDDDDDSRCFYFWQEIDE